MNSTRSHNAMNSTRIARSGLVGMLIMGAVLVMTAGTAGAADGCGEFSFGFEGTQLLNDGISDSAGPFPIVLPAGVYDITMKSHDAHDEHPGQSDQTAEQWFVVLDSGYRSPSTNDIADDQNYSTTVFVGQEIEESAAISVHHRREGNVNSVEVICVGFTASSPVVPAADIVDPDGALDVPAEVEGVVELPESPVEQATTTDPDLIDPVGLTQLPAEQVEPAVHDNLQSTVPLLAITGPSVQTIGLLFGALALITMGGLLVLVERRVLLLSDGLPSTDSRR